jgi:hypothetical protein
MVSEWQSCQEQRRRHGLPSPQTNVASILRLPGSLNQLRRERTLQGTSRQRLTKRFVIFGTRPVSPQRRGRVDTVPLHRSVFEWPHLAVGILLNVCFGRRDRQQRIELRPSTNRAARVQTGR